MSSSAHRSILAAIFALALGAALFAGVASVRSKAAATAAAADAPKPAIEFLPADLHTLKAAPLSRTLPLTGTFAALNEER